jgi:hypothetical protein
MLHLSSGLNSDLEVVFRFETLNQIPEKSSIICADSASVISSLFTPKRHKFYIRKENGRWMRQHPFTQVVVIMQYVKFLKLGADVCHFLLTVVNVWVS